MNSINMTKKMMCTEVEYLTGLQPVLTNIVASYLQFNKMTLFIKKIKISHCGGHFEDGLIIGNKLCLLHRGVTGDYIEICDFNEMSLNNTIKPKSIGIYTGLYNKSLAAFGEKIGTIAKNKKIFVHNLKGKIESTIKYPSCDSFIRVLERDDKRYICGDKNVFAFNNKNSTHPIINIQCHKGRFVEMTINGDLIFVLSQVDLYPYPNEIYFVKIYNMSGHFVKEFKLTFIREFELALGPHYVFIPMRLYVNEKEIYIVCSKHIFVMCKETGIYLRVIPFHDDPETMVEFNGKIYVIARFGIYVYENKICC